MENQLRGTESEPAKLTSVTPFSLAPWFPIIGLLLMAVLSSILLRSVVNHAMTSTFSEFLARIMWSISVLFFALTITATFATCFRIIGTTLRSVKLRIGTLAVLFIAAAIIVTLYLLFEVQKLRFNETLLGGTVYMVAPLTETIVGSVQILAAVALAALAIAVSFILLRAGLESYRVAESSVTSRIASLARNQQTVRNLLYISAIALVAGAFEASALYSWAKTMMTEPISSPLEYYSKVKDLPIMMGTLNGLFYSILLAVIFAPAFIGLRGIANRLVSEAKPDATFSEQNQWLKDHEVTGSVSQQLFSALAVLAPTIAGGPLTTLLGLITPS